MVTRNGLRLGVVSALAAAAIVGCGEPPAPTSSDGHDPDPPSSAQPTRTPRATDESPTPSTTPERIRLAFAGDVHFERQLRPLLDDPETALDPIRPVLEDADVTMVNLETALTTGGTPEPKNYTFHAAPEALDALAAAGVDVVSMANNHGADYGADGLADTLDAAAHGPVAVVGVGADIGEAFEPYVAEVRGQRIAFLGGTAFPDPTTDNWSAGPDDPGVASALDPERLLDEVEAARDVAEVVVVYLHWGLERVRCPTPEQQELAGLLADAGADVVVGSHAHIQLGTGLLDGTYVSYGLGNFVWYTRNSEDEATTGVLHLTLEDGRVVDTSWTPATVGEDGLPRPATGGEAATMVAELADLRSCTNLEPAPGLEP